MIKGAKYYVNNVTELLIYNLLQSLHFAPTIEHFDFTTIGLRTETPVYGVGGIKESASYSMVLDGDESVDDLGNDTSVFTEVVRKEFTYSENGVDILIKWFSKDGSVGLEKHIFKPLNIVEVFKINKSNRDRTISWLEASAVGTPIEPYVNALLREYKTEVDLYIYNNTNDFIDRVNNETNEPFLTYLNIVVGVITEQYPNGKTVKDSITEQIS